MLEPVMKTVLDYRHRAAEFAKKAETELDLEKCEHLLRMAGHWIRAAKNQEWLHAHSLAASAAAKPLK